MNFLGKKQLIQKSSNYILKNVIFVNIWNLGQFCEN